ncbi:MAG: hypothetical protein MZV64_64705 [Ignavibacteriales bacterium]|nr:hypothetical protein [Ignavibacteriales bacterium]
MATAGVTLYNRQLQVPEGRKYIAVDGGMADNPRPAMYQAVYHAIVANKANEPASQTVTIAGRYCESGDILIKDINLPDVEAGDIICVFATGAYNYSMSSNYNRIPRPAADFSTKWQIRCYNKRETLKHLSHWMKYPND